MVVLYDTDFITCLVIVINALGHWRFSANFAVARDPRPQWRRMLWSEEGSLLAVAMRWAGKG